MKKYLCGLTSILTGGLMYVFFALAALVYSGFMGTQTTNMYNLINFSEYASTELIILSIVNIAALVVAGLLVVAGILSLLKALDVVKIKFKVNALSVILALVLLVLVVASFVLILVQKGDNIALGIGVYLSLGISVVGFLLNLLTCKEVKSRKRK